LEQGEELLSELQILAVGRSFRLCFVGRDEIETSLIRCPLCHAANCRRSRRRSVKDYLLGFTGALPWRCESCETRFRARAIPFRAHFYAHCGFCGNFELQSISAKRMKGVAGILGRFLELPALRCAPCRHKFFSVRPLRHEVHPAAAAPTK